MFGAAHCLELQLFSFVCDAKQRLGELHAETLHYSETRTEWNSRGHLYRDDYRDGPQHPAFDHDAADSKLAEDQSLSGRRHIHILDEIHCVIRACLDVSVFFHASNLRGSKYVIGEFSASRRRSFRQRT